MLKKQQLFHILEKLNASEKAYIKKYSLNQHKKNTPIVQLLSIVENALKKKLKE